MDAVLKAKLRKLVEEEAAKYDGWNDRAIKDAYDRAGKNPMARAAGAEAVYDYIYDYYTEITLTPV